MYVAPPPSTNSIVEGLTPERTVNLLRSLPEVPVASSGEEYRHWDKIRHLAPPDGLTHEEWWWAIKVARRQNLRKLPLNDASGRPFQYSLPDQALRLLAFVDRHCAGEIAMPEVVTANEQAKTHYLVNSLMEEAIRSSQLEGATTSRSAAKEMLRSGRTPKDRSELMILNNYRALEFMRQHAGSSLTPELVFALHRIVTEGTLDNPDVSGRLQGPNDQRVAVFDAQDGELTHRPPPAEQLPERLQSMCRFANEKVDAGAFMHPVVRAILLHFWLAYDHPFEDGNGRTARALFYWSMKESGYWLTDYLSISRILRQAPSQYTRAYLETETDEGDTTYFILYQLGVIERAVKELTRYLERKVGEVREIERLVHGSADFNHRQLALLSDAARRTDAQYTFRSHASTHNVSEETARTDLLELYERGLLARRRAGRRHVFTPVQDLTEKLKTSP